MTQVTNERLAELIGEEEKAMHYWIEQDQTYSFISARDRASALRELQQARSDLAATKEALDNATQAIKIYGEHAPMCSAMVQDKCDCGFDAARGKT